MNKVYCTFFLIAAISGCSEEKVRTTDKPNIILIFTDDQGYADLSIQNIDSLIKTPNIDYLARNGVRFTDGYVTAPQCSPSRAGIITGRYQQKFGFDDNEKGPIPKNEVTIADRLKSLGYSTGMVGKWHMDPNHTSSNWLKQNYPKTLNDPKEPIPVELTRPHTPEANGFDEFFWGTMRSYYANFNLRGKKYDKARRISNKAFRVDVQTEAAIQFIKNHKSDPFFLYVSYFAPHVPLEADEKYLRRFKHVGVERRKYGLAMMSAIDDGVGNLLLTLRKLNLEKETLIFFISDNGAPLKLYKPDSPITGVPGPEWDGSLNDPWIGEKGMLSEGGIRIPYIMYWKDHLPKGKVYNHPVITLDVAATAMSAGGATKPDTLIDGVNLIPYISDTNKAPERALYWRFWKQSAIRDGKWKYLRLSDKQEYLFDLNSDKHEYVNLINEHPKIVKKLRRKLRNWSKELKEPGLPKGKLIGQEKNWYDYHFSHFQ